ncbi:glycoside hydrolase family 15 protein [Kribbella sp. NPDC050124]|uniref:glycoside hydrolase family 15 protein n=1 Tax=Kribbella sp. NPDC050124 TaxID=3364114 RepID=UPI003798A52B
MAGECQRPRGACQCAARARPEPAGETLKHMTRHDAHGPSMALHIEDYALIGDLRTAALVGVDGAINWLPMPRFDSPAIFAALLGDERHGNWVLAPVNRERCSRRRYRPETLVLETEWTTGSGAVRVTDLMVPGSSDPMVVRIVDGLVGTVAMRTHLAPRMGYGKEVPTLRTDHGQLVASAGREQLWLDSDVTVTETDLSWAGDFLVSAGERVTFTLLYTAGEPRRPAPDAGAALDATDAFWTEWVGRSTYTGAWASEVNQSLVILKALTYAPTGSILAAPTTSLPEQLGGSRNWDYRYSWLRDATFTAQAFLATGHLEEVAAWRDWLVRTVIDDPSGMQIMYAVDGAAELPEQTLDWLPGYGQSKPVRVGNAAARQQQNDVWGEVLDILWAARDAGLPDAADQEKLERALLDQIEAHWQEPDHGLWEVRGPRRQFVHSKLLAWVGVDRAVRRLEEHNNGDIRQLTRLRALRRTIADQIVERGYHPGRAAFTQSYGSPHLDAAVLLMPRYGFLPSDDPRIVATVEAIQRELTEDGLVLRYAVTDDGHNVDGVPGSEGTFVATSFWLADALQIIGRTGDAIELFERLLTVRNDVGLLSEEYDARTGRHLGNTPQAFSHAGLVTTAVTLSAADGSKSHLSRPYSDLSLEGRADVA